MPAYFVYVCQEVIDRAELETHWTKIGATLEGYHSESLGSYTPFEQHDCDAVGGVAVVRFPSMDTARAWYEGPAYRAICHHRQNGARYIGLLVEAGSPPVDLRMPHTKGRRPVR